MTYHFSSSFVFISLCFSILSFISFSCSLSERIMFALNFPCLKLLPQLFHAICLFIVSELTLNCSCKTLYEHITALYESILLIKNLNTLYAIGDFDINQSSAL